MHIYVAGLGGAGLNPLAQLAHQLGYKVSGSDLKDNPSFAKMKKWQPPPVINIGQTAHQIAQTHKQQSIDWYIYSSALAWAKPANPELAWVKKNKIKHSKRDEFLNFLLKQIDLKLLAVAGSHGKTTTTAMLIWALKTLNQDISYALGGKLMNQPSAQINLKSNWFIYEADEFDYNFLAFYPHLSLITGLDYDHPEVYPTLRSYRLAFSQFIQQSQKTIMNQADYLKISKKTRLQNKILTINLIQPHPQINLLGFVNRQNATLALSAIKQMNPNLKSAEIIQALNQFPGSWRRFEQIAPNLYSDYAHNPKKIAGCLQIAQELKKPLVVVYEPHSNRRQHYILKQYKDLFSNVAKLYWLPSHLAREDENLKTFTPQELIQNLNNPHIAQVATMNNDLKESLKNHLKVGDVVIGMSAGNLDYWLRSNLGHKDYLKF